ncbi:hypothetical protein [Okeania sp. KiyG1]|uniref:hypothetical protein n=1 Tax=Okeania sp. KiyG1 TaxID=2720165 RepID=UPI0019210592|nr:hypothetical protein [Okeania sp. KiyG1]
MDENNLIFFPHWKAIAFFHRTIVRCAAKTIAPYYFSLSGEGKRKLCLSQGKFSRRRRMDGNNLIFFPHWRVINC